MGKQTEIPNDSDVILFGHSLIDIDALKTSFIGVHFIRDPRDIIVSGYLYHSRTTEKWCINTDFSLEPPILSPKVPYSQQYRSEGWKINYLKSLGGKSYQQNLLNLSQSDGLLFEMNNYGAWTLESMQQWHYNRGNILEVRFESLMNDFDTVFQVIFEYLGFSKSQIRTALSIVARHDLKRKTDKQIQAMKHVSFRETSKWQSFFKEKHKNEFRSKFGNILIDLEYEKTNEW